MKRVSAAQAKTRLSDLISEVEHGGGRVLIERRGRPVAALVSLDDLRSLGEPLAPGEPGGLFALAGAWGDLLTDQEIDEMVERIYADRRKGMPPSPVTPG